MKSIKFSSILILSLLFLGFTNSFSQDIKGKWKRDDGSVYKFNDNQAVLIQVGYYLKKGLFNEGEVKIRDIFIDEGDIYGFSKINDSEGKTLKWKKIKLEKKDENYIHIFDLEGNKLTVLNKLSGNKDTNHQAGLNGIWKRSNDGSLYKFENDIAVLDRVGWKLEKGKFRLEQVKIRDIVKTSDNAFRGKTRINDTEGNLVRWSDIRIYKNNNTLQIKWENSNRSIFLKKYGQSSAVSENDQKEAESISDDSSTDKKEQVYSKIPIDYKVPETNAVKQNTYALIIGNEDYKKYQTSLSAEANVKFAMNDAKIFKKYCRKTLGIPEENIKLGINRISSQMKRDIKWLISRAKYGGPNVNLIFYYAGHGFPNPKNSEKYLMPVDITGSQVTDGIKLSKLYSQLVEYPANKVTVFLDACFSGGGRKQGLLAARAVKIEPKKNPINTGNLVVFSGSSGEQESLFHKEKQHGIFTYYLLKKIQETEGDVTYESLRNYLQKKVPMKAIDLFYKEQVPEVNISQDVKNKWKNWKLK
jgi:hypothetical protein